MKQLALLREKKYRKRKTARAIAIRRGTNHVILKSRQPLLRKHRRIVLRSIRETQDRFEIRLHALAVMENHIHLIIRASSREQFANSLRMLAGTIARRITKKGAFWQQRAWSRVVRAGRDLETVTRYVACNPIRTEIWTVCDSFWIRDGILQL